MRCKACNEEIHGKDVELCEVCMVEVENLYYPYPADDDITTELELEDGPFNELERYHDEH